MRSKLLEWSGVVTAIAYTFINASNTGNEVMGFALLFISSILIGLWAWFDRHRGILFLQFFYAAGGIYGMLSWSGMLSA